MTIPANLLKHSIFTSKIATVFEKMRVFSPVTTVIRATAKTIDLPGLTVDAAVNHSIADQNTVGTATPSNSTITVDVKTDKSVNYGQDDYQDDLVGFKALTKDEILKVITTKVNLNFTDGILAGATAVASTQDLSTNALVSAFLSDMAVDAAQLYFSWKPKVEHGSVVQAKYIGKAMLICGSTAYKRILDANSSIRFQSTTEAQNNSETMFISPQGVVVMNAGSSFADLKQMVWGVAGIPVHAYRSDKISEWDIPINARTTAAANNGEVTLGDDMIQRDFNMGAEIWNKVAIPTVLASHMKKRLMA